MTDAAAIAEGLSEAERALVRYLDSGKLARPVSLIAAGANVALLNRGLTVLEEEGDDVGDLTPLGRQVAAILEQKA